MPAGVCHHETRTSQSDDLGLALPVSLPSEQLLRTDGSVAPSSALSAHEAAERLREDACLLLRSDDTDAVGARWATPGFARQVGAVRRHLGPIVDPEVLAASFAREAFHERLLGHLPATASSPVRVAYAIRWMELQADLRLPAWRHWLPSCPRES